jgi:hypothetical protein
LQAVAEVHPDEARRPMTRAERLTRWAELLERDPDRRLASLPGTEYQPPARRDTMRSSGSPITVAFEDPGLRREGLKDDTYGEAKRFFELTDWQLHDIVCYCHFGETMTSRSAARRVRAAIDGQPNLFTRLRDAFVG